MPPGHPQEIQHLPFRVQYGNRGAVGNGEPDWERCNWPSLVARYVNGADGPGHLAPRQSRDALYDHLTRCRHVADGDLILRSSDTSRMRPGGRDYGEQERQDEHGCPWPTVKVPGAFATTA
jgi:hypothetical protein